MNTSPALSYLRVFVVLLSPRETSLVAMQKAGGPSRACHEFTQPREHGTHNGSGSKCTGAFSQLFFRASSILHNHNNNDARPATERKRERECGCCCVNMPETDRLFRARQVFHNELASLREIFIYFSLSVSTFICSYSAHLSHSRDKDRSAPSVFGENGLFERVPGNEDTAKGFNRILVALFFLLNSPRPPDRREIGHDAGSRSFSRISRIPATRESAGNEETAALIFL